jgi:acylphosphatase
VQGQIDAASVIPWICHRAALLDLKGWVRREDGASIRVLVCGPSPLLDAMEIACSLGPGDAMVHCVDRESVEIASPPNGFTVRCDAP